MERDEALRLREDELADAAEDVAIAVLLTRRLERSSGKTISGADFIRELGFPELAADLPQ